MEEFCRELMIMQAKSILIHNGVSTFFKSVAL